MILNVCLTTFWILGNKVNSEFFPAEEVFDMYFSASDDIYLNIITCRALKTKFAQYVLKDMFSKNLGLRFWFDFLR